MLELLGFFYEVAKDLKGYLRWEEQEKVVDRDWLVQSGLEKRWTDEGYKLYWSRPDRIATLQLEGWSLLYQIDPTIRIRYRIVRCDGITLMGRPITP